MKTIFAAGAGMALALSAMPAAAQDTAREEAAQATVDHVFPAGTYERLMRGTLDQMTAQMMDSMIDMPMRDIVGSMGLPEEEVATLGRGSMRQMMAIFDPHFEERMKITNTTMMNGMVDVMTGMEPAMREGLAEAYADKFTAEELAGLNAFFATPLGSKYAANSMTIFMDPKMMTRMQETMPAIMEAMPDLIGEVREATAHLPAPRTLSDLTDEEREELTAIVEGE